jgi:hypothetical protein
MTTHTITKVSNRDPTKKTGVNSSVHERYAVPASYKLLIFSIRVEKVCQRDKSEKYIEITVCPRVLTSLILTAQDHR